MILFGERHIRYVIGEYVKHYLAERPHQGLGNVRVQAPETPQHYFGLVLVD